MTTTDPETRKMVFDGLAKHGKKGIATIHELINLTVDTDVKQHGLKAIEHAE
jgi:hypothetical protein